MATSDMTVVHFFARRSLYRGYYMIANPMVVLSGVEGVLYYIAQGELENHNSCIMTLKTM
jgi:hypothetical protein